MGTFDALKQRCTFGDIPPVPISSGDRNRIEQKFPGIPADYVAFMEEVGFGEVGRLQIYSGPIAYNSIYPRDNPSKHSIILIGDDLQGYCVGFDRDEGYKMVEVNPKGEARKLTANTFREFIEKVCDDDNL